jgi:short-subunit dehydrogenase
MRLEGSTALITGASAGIGREFARQLAPLARRLVLVARRRDRLDQLRDELTAAHPAVDIETSVVDLSDRAQLAGLTNWLGTESGDVDFLINNAGLGDMGSFATGDPQRLEQIVLVNMNALTLLTRAVLPGMIAKRKGAILNVSSCAGFLPIAQFAVYAASKAYVTSFTEALRAELRGTGVTASVLCPGPVRTEFGDVAYRPGTHHRSSPAFVNVGAEKVARLGLDAIERNKPLVIPGVVMKLAMFFTRLTPMPILRLVARFSSREAAPRERRSPAGP